MPILANTVQQNAIVSKIRNIWSQFDTGALLKLVPSWPGNPFGGRVHIMQGLVLKRIGTGKDDDGAPPRSKKPEEWHQ